MSRTYKFRNKDNKPNKYIKDYFSFNSFVGDTEENKIEIEKNIKTYVSGKGWGLGVPRHYRRYKNKIEKRSFEQQMKRKIREGREEEIFSPNPKKNAGYDWF